MGSEFKIEIDLTCYVVNFIILEVCEIYIHIAIDRYSVGHLAIYLTSTRRAVETVVRIVDARLTEVGDKVVAVITLDASVV